MMVPKIASNSSATAFVYFKSISVSYTWHANPYLCVTTKNGCYRKNVNVFFQS